MHLCLAQCDPYRCPVCDYCTKQPGLCRECKLARQMLPPAPKGRGLDGLRKEMGLDA